MNRRAFPRIFNFAAVLPFVFGADSGNSFAEQTAVTAGSRTLPVAPLGPPNPWPQFRFQIPETPVAASANLGAEDRAGMFSNAAVPTLPYLMQDNYTRQRQSGTPADHPSRKRGAPRDLLSFAGRADDLPLRQAGAARTALRQPGLAVRQSGHPQRVVLRRRRVERSAVWPQPADLQPGLRRCRSQRRAGRCCGSTSSIARWKRPGRWTCSCLPATTGCGSTSRPSTPTRTAVRFYWWTNIAVPLARDTRVLSPADYALSHDLSGNARLAFPIFDGFDGSYPFQLRLTPSRSSSASPATASRGRSAWTAKAAG